MRWCFLEKGFWLHKMSFVLYLLLNIEPYSVHITASKWTFKYVSISTCRTLDLYQAILLKLNEQINKWWFYTTSLLLSLSSFAPPPPTVHPWLSLFLFAASDSPQRSHLRPPCARTPIFMAQRGKDCNKTSRPRSSVSPDIVAYSLRTFPSHWVFRDAGIHQTQDIKLSSTN